MRRKVNPLTFMMGAAILPASRYNPGMRPIVLLCAALCSLAAMALHVLVSAGEGRPARALSKTLRRWALRYLPASMAGLLAALAVQYVLDGVSASGIFR